MVVAKQKITLSKDASKKKKRIEVIQNNHHSNHHAMQAAQNPGEEDENGYVSTLWLSSLARLEDALSKTLLRLP